MDNERLVRAYTTVTYGMRGFFAVLMGTFRRPDGVVYDDPINTSCFSYKRRSAAVLDAQEWAEAEGIECLAE